MATILLHRTSDASGPATVNMKTSRGPGRVTLPRAVSKLGFASRTRALSLVLEGEVKVNGAVEKNPHRWVDVERDRIEIQAQHLRRQSYRYCLMNKPKGAVTTRSDERGARTVFEVLEGVSSDLLAVGRLDKASAGLLLFTNDHRFAEQVTNPATGLPKTYRVVVDRPLSDADVRSLADGVEIPVEGALVRTKRAIVRRTGVDEIEISITEGKNRQIRKMLSAMSYEVVSLTRIAIGPLQLGKMTPGSVRDLTLDELKMMKELMSRTTVLPLSTSKPERSKRSVRGKRRFPHS